MIEGKFYICSQNKLLDSDYANTKLCDSWKVNWTPDRGGLFETFNKQTDYVITFNNPIDFDLIKFYFLPSTDYYWGTRQRQERVFDLGLIVKIEYTTNGFDWFEINHYNAFCINNWFNLNNRGYDIINGGWNCGTLAEVLFLKLNNVISNVIKLKFRLNWSNPDISNWGITELEIKQTKEIKIKDINIDNERSILNNTLNDFKIIINTYDVDYSIYNFITANCEIFGYIYKDDIYHYFSNLIVDEANINISQRILTLILTTYDKNYFNEKVNYNTPILFKKAYYTSSHCLELLLLQANIPQYFVDFYSGNFTQAVYYPNAEMSIKEELNDFLKSNLNIKLYRNYKNYFTIRNYGNENYSIISQTYETYTEYQNGFTENNNFLNPIFFTKKALLNDDFFNNFFQQDLIITDNYTKVYETIVKTILKRKVKKIGPIKITSKEIVFENERVEVNISRDTLRFPNFQLLDFPKSKKKIEAYYNSYDGTDDFYIDAEEIKVNCLTVPFSQNPNNAMECGFDLYLADLNLSEEGASNVFTQPDKIIFKYRDIRGEQTITYQMPTKRGLIPNTKLRYNYKDNTKHYLFRVRLILPFAGAGILRFGYYTRNRTNNQESALWAFDVGVNDADGMFLRSFMQQQLSGYTTGICEITLTCNKNITEANTKYVNYKFKGIYITGISRKYEIKTFPLIDCSDVNIKEWKEEEFYNLSASSNNISSETYYQFLGETFKLEKKQYNLDKLRYPVTGDLNFIYLIKNVYPYTSYGKLWHIKSITHSNFLTFNKTYLTINKLSKSLNYTKTISNLDNERIVTRLSYYLNTHKVLNKTDSLDFSLNQYEIIEKNYKLDNEYLIIGKTIFDVIINNKVYSFYQSSGTFNQNDLNFDYEFKEDLYNIYVYIKNNSTNKLEGKIIINYQVFTFEGIKNVIDYEDLQKRYGIIEYELLSGQLMTHTQVWVIKKFLEQYYNLQNIFNNNDIVFDCDLNVNFDDFNLKIEDRYLNKYLTVEPYYINHYINEDLYSETSIRGKIANVEDIV